MKIPNYDGRKVGMKDWNRSAVWRLSRHQWSSYRHISRPNWLPVSCWSHVKYLQSDWSRCCHSHYRVSSFPRWTMQLLYSVFSWVFYREDTVRDFLNLNATVPSSAPAERLFQGFTYFFATSQSPEQTDRHFEQLLLLKANAGIYENEWEWECKCLTCSQKLTGSQFSLLHEPN